MLVRQLRLHAAGSPGHRLRGRLVRVRRVDREPPRSRPLDGRRRNVDRHDRGRDRPGASECAPSGPARARHEPAEPVPVLRGERRRHDALERRVRRRLELVRLARLRRHRGRADGGAAARALQADALAGADAAHGDEPRPDDAAVPEPLRQPVRLERAAGRDAGQRNLGELRQPGEVDQHDDRRRRPVRLRRGRPSLPVPQLQRCLTGGELLGRSDRRLDARPRRPRPERGVGVLHPDDLRPDGEQDALARNPARVADEDRRDGLDDAGGVPHALQPLAGRLQRAMWRLAGTRRFVGGGQAHVLERRGGYVVAVERAPGDTSTLWAATTTGRVFISKNADADPATSVTFTRRDTLAANDPNRFVSSIYVDPANANHAWISYTGFSAATPTTPGHVFDVTYNAVAGTATWVSLDGTLGDLPINDLVRDDVTGDLYAATDSGVLSLASGSSSWLLAGPGMPNIEVAGLTIVAADRKLYAATHAMGAWRFNLP